MGSPAAGLVKVAHHAARVWGWLLLQPVCGSLPPPLLCHVPVIISVRVRPLLQVHHQGVCWHLNLANHNTLVIFAFGHGALEAPLVLEEELWAVSVVA